MIPADYEVFEPSDEHVAQIIVRILEEKGYRAGYQLGYPKNKIFINVNAREEADRISRIIGRFTEKFSLTERGMTTDKLNALISRLSSLIPEMPNGKLISSAENIENNSKISESEIFENAKLEEWRGKIVERLNLLNTLMIDTPNDPSNEKRKIEIDTLIWVLQSVLISPK